MQGASLEGGFPMRKQIVARPISFLIGLAFAGFARAQAPLPGSGGVVEFFQPDASEFSAGNEALPRGPSADGSSRGRLILVNTATNNLFVTVGEKVVFQARCSTGKGTSLKTGDGNHLFITPKGDFLVQSKEEHPAPQRRFESVLGAYRISFGGGFGIHGTDEPDRIGRSVTHGCVRLSDADIRALYALVEVGDEVVIF